MSEGTVNGYPRQVWWNADGETIVESYTITDMAHGTPLGIGDNDKRYGTQGAFLIEAGISSSYQIANFFGLTEWIRRPHEAAKLAEKQSARQSAAQAARPAAAKKAAKKIPVAAPAAAPAPPPEPVVSSAPDPPGVAAVAGVRSSRRAAAAAEAARHRRRRHYHARADGGGPDEVNSLVARRQAANKPHG